MTLKPWFSRFVYGNLGPLVEIEKSVQPYQKYEPQNQHFIWISLLSSWRLSLHSNSDYHTSSNTVSFIGNWILAPQRDSIRDTKLWESGSNRLNPLRFGRNHPVTLHWAFPVWLNDMIQPNAESPEQNWSKQLNEKHSNLAVDRRFKVKFISNDIIGTDIVKYYPAKAVISLNFIVESQELTKNRKIITKL